MNEDERKSNVKCFDNMKTKFVSPKDDLWRTSDWAQEVCVQTPHGRCLECYKPKITGSCSSNGLG